MALAVASSRLASEAHGPSENTPSAVHRLQMAIADTECAQALLELAMSIVPAPCESTHQEQILNQSFPTCSKERSPDSYKEEELDTLSNSSRIELLKRIKLDHNYYWTGEERKGNEVKLEPEQFRSYCETIKQNGSILGTLETGEEDENEPKFKPPKKNTFDRQIENNLPSFSCKNEDRIQSITRQRATSESCSGSIRRKQRQRSVSESKVRVKRTDKNLKIRSRESHSYGGLHKIEKNQVEGQDSEPDNELETNDKFHNFHLLMKCLAANKPDFQNTPDTSRSNRTQSMSSDDTDENSSDVTKQSELSHSYQCQVCQKSFVKKRYLTKHAYRMHPWLVNEDGSQIKVTLEGLDCPYCKITVNPKKDLQRHISNCPKNYTLWKVTQKLQNELPLVNCQFCGVKMRRQLLVRHLAEEHCVDRIGDSSEENNMQGLEMLEQDYKDNMLFDTVNAKSVACLSESPMVDEANFRDNPGVNAASTDIPWDKVDEFGASKYESRRKQFLQHETDSKADM